MRVLLEHGKRETVRVRAESVAVRAGAQHDVEHPLRTTARREHLDQLVGIPALDVRPRARHRFLHEPADDEVVEGVDVGVRSQTLQHRREPKQRLPFRDLARLEVHQRR